MTDTYTIKNPVRFAERKAIRPIEVIESWSLGHHLACAVECLESAGRCRPALEDLKEAKWYITRDLNRYQEFLETSHIPLQATNRFLVGRICSDWNLSLHLSEVLDNIRASKIPSLREAALTEALDHLSAEISRHEFLQRMD